MRSKKELCHDVLAQESQVSQQIEQLLNILPENYNKISHSKFEKMIEY